MHTPGGAIMTVVLGGSAQIRQVVETGGHVITQGGGDVTGMQQGGGGDVTGMQQGGGGAMIGMGVGAGQHGVVTQHDGGGALTGMGSGVGALGGRLMTFVMVTVTCCFWS
jgi:hypothetical protein